MYLAHINITSIVSTNVSSFLSMCNLYFAQVTDSDGTSHTIRYKQCVLCCGAWSGDIARLAGLGQDGHIHPTLGVELPVEKRFASKDNFPPIFLDVETGHTL